PHYTLGLVALSSTAPDRRSPASRRRRPRRPHPRLSLRSPPASGATGARLILGCVTIPMFEDRRDVRLRPLSQRRDGLLQGPPELGQRILHPRRSLGEDLA